MIQDLTHALAYAAVSWLPPDQGGRRSGPPTDTVYAATCVFAQGDDASILPGWPSTADHLSILLQEVNICT